MAFFYTAHIQGSSIKHTMILLTTLQVYAFTTHILASHSIPHGGDQSGGDSPINYTQKEIRLIDKSGMRATRTHIKIPSLCPCVRIRPTNWTQHAKRQ